MRIGTNVCVESALGLCENAEYDAAIGALGEMWPPRLESTDPRLLLVWGVITSGRGVAERIAGAQEFAKDLLSRSARLFREDELAAFARVHLALCYWRMGERSNALARLSDVLSGRISAEARFAGLLTKGISETEAGEFQAALDSLAEAEPLLELVSQTCQGKFHHHRAIALQELGALQNSEELKDRALVEYEAASFSFEESGARRFEIAVTNNLARLYSVLGQHSRALANVDRAISLCKTIKDLGTLPRLYDQKAQIYLDEKHPRLAESEAEAAVQLLKDGDQQGVLVEALITYGTALARSRKPDKAYDNLERAVNLAEELGDQPQLCYALTALLAEVHLPPSEAFQMYQRLEDACNDRHLLIRAGRGVMKSVEGGIIRLALEDSRGYVPAAAKLLELTGPGLSFKLNTQFPELLPCRIPARKRKRSKKHAAKK